jgi:hypothetical protein
MDKEKPANRLIADRLLPFVPWSGRAARLISAALVVWSCGGSGAGSNTPTDELPVYGAADAELFDDSVAPAVFGFGSSKDEFETTPAFEDLVRAADLIQRVRLVTITRAKSATSVVYHLELEFLGEAIVGSATEEGAAEVSVGFGSRSVGLLRSVESESVGTKFIVFLKRYAANGEPIWHFRALADSAAILAAIESVN